jgi:hypothetical protein
MATARFHARSYALPDMPTGLPSGRVLTAVIPTEDSSADAAAGLNPTAIRLAAVVRVERNPLRFSTFLCGFIIFSEYDFKHIYTSKAILREFYFPL